ncbi:MAG: lysostaphin resistance A-like protein [Acidimicrobiia bacterium]
MSAPEVPFLDAPAAGPDDGGYLPESAWDLWHVFFVFAGGLVGAIVGGAAVVAVGGDVESAGSVFGIVFPAQVAGSLGVAWYLSHSRGTGRWAADFGLRLRARHVWGLVAGVGLQLGALFVTGLTILILGGDAAPSQDVAEVAEGSTGAALALAFVATVVFAPLVEEIVYRGMLLSRLRRTMRRHGAALTAAAVFAAVHLLDPGTLLLQPGLFFIGAVLGYAALRSKDLSLPLFLHAGVNLTGLLLQQFADELADWAENIDSGMAVVLRSLG